MLLERRTVSRKTPADGKLEITEQAARRIERLGEPFVIDVSGVTAPGKLDTFACTCRGAEKPHVHYFLQAERLKALSPGSGVDVELDDAGRRVIVRSA
jgi:hypothetical protein